MKVAAALEGMKFEVFDGGEGFMRKDDHQFFQPIYISSFGVPADKARSRSTRRTPAGAGTSSPRSTPPQTMLPTTCNMNAALMRSLPDRACRVSLFGVARRRSFVIRLASVPDIKFGIDAVVTDHVESFSSQAGAPWLS